jgi:hypothetical protein
MTSVLDRPLPGPLFDQKRGVGISRRRVLLLASVVPMTGLLELTAAAGGRTSAVVVHQGWILRADDLPRLE